MAKKRRQIPKAWIYVDRDDTQTLSLRDRETGKMEGRRVVHKREKGDRTFPRRVSKGPYAGEILGRSKAIPVRGDEKKRGAIRRRL